LPEVDDLLKTKMGESVATHWPELNTRLGTRVGEFLDIALGNASTHAIAQNPAIQRFVNLCCAFGPNFERRPENEWALAILADERLGEWTKLHQLVVRGATELKRSPADGRATSDQLLRADGALLDALDRQQRAVNSESVRLERLACDLDAVDIRLLEVDWRNEYRNIAGTWQLVPVTGAASSIRIDPTHPAPAMVCVLTHAPAAGPEARLQIRLLTHSVCDQDRHPLVVFAGDHGLWPWKGHNARAVSWIVNAHPLQVATNGLGSTLVEETVPRTSLLQASTCGLRDEGLPVGSLHTHVWAYPADQWLFVLQREAGAESRWPRSDRSPAEASFSPTRCRIERDGLVQSSARWAQAFTDTLDPAMLRGFETLFAAWQQAATDASMTLTAGLMSGRSTLTWGWREGAQGLAGAPLMRVLGDFDLHNAIDLSLSGEIVLGVTRTRVRLRVTGDSPMQQQIAREQAAPGLLDALLPAVGRWRFDYRVEFDPIAVEVGALWSEAGPCTGAIAGEAGLRPRVTGGSGWQWYARLDSEAVSLPICIHDPVLGQTRRTLTLLPALRLLDWNLG
jgi:hypothetical protein